MSQRQATKKRGRDNHFKLWQHWNDRRSLVLRCAASFLLPLYCTVMYLHVSMSCHTIPFEAKDGDFTEESAPIIRNLITSAPSLRGFRYRGNSHFDKLNPHHAVTMHTVSEGTK